MRALAAVMADEQFQLDANKVEKLRQRKRLIGDDGLLSILVTATPLGNMVRFYSGVEHLAYFCADCPGRLGDLLAAVEDNYMRRLRLTATLDADAVVSVDDTSTTTISPAMFRRYEMPFIDRAVELFHDAGIIYCHHSCGLIRDLLESYRETKMDAVDALQVPPMGDVTIREAKSKLGDNIVIIASLNQLFGPMDDWNAVAASVREMFEGARPMRRRPSVTPSRRPGGCP